MEQNTVTVPENQQCGGKWFSDHRPHDSDVILDHREEDRAALLAAFNEQMAEKERKRQEVLAQEGRFRQELFAKFAREARLEQLSQQKRKLAIAEHNRQVRLQGQTRLIIQQATENSNTNTTCRYSVQRPLLKHKY